MKVLSTSLVAAAMLAAAASSPALANGAQSTVQLGSGSCPLNAIRCVRPGRPIHPRCYVVSVPDGNGGVRKQRVCKRFE